MIGPVACWRFPIARQQGLYDGLAVNVDKVQKGGSIICLDLTRDVAWTLIAAWMDSRRLLSIYLAPVCGTGFQARDIQVHPTDVKPLRSCVRPS